MAVNTDRRIKLSWACSRFILGQTDGIRVRIEVECAEGVDTRIFAYLMGPLDPVAGVRAGSFSHVCSATDLEEFPAEEPTPGNVPEWFRLSYVDVLLRSEIEAQAFIEDVRSDVRMLKVSLDAIDVTQPTGDEDVGGDGTCPGDPASSSSSSSAAPETPESSSESLGSLQFAVSTGSIEQNVGSYGALWTSIGSGAGSPVGNSDDGASNRSSVALAGGLISRLLLIRGFDFNDLVPADAQIDGIAVRLFIRRAPAESSSSSAASESSEAPQDLPKLFLLQLYHPDRGLVGENKAQNDVLDGPTWSELDFGGTTDLWDEVWTAAALRRGDFGVGVIVGSDDEAPEAVVEVDGVEITVYYRE